MEDRELFSELYSSYYQLTADILTEAREQGGITRGRMEEIAEEGFLESTLYLLPRLISGEYNLMERRGDKFYSKCGSGEAFGLTGLERSWLKSLLIDERIRLFLTEEQLAQWKNTLTDVEPLFEQEDFYYFDRYRDGDRYSDEGYRANFRMILEALQLREKGERGGVLRILYRTRRSGLSRIFLVPDKLQYSARDDCFRLSGCSVREGRAKRPLTLRLSRLEEVGLSLEERPSEEEIQACLRSEMPAPVLFRIYPERNALDRCMLHFASYKKETERENGEDGEETTYLCRLYYHKDEETELLIRLLSFGPVIRVLGPEPILEQMRERLKRQQELFEKEGFHVGRGN